MSGYLKRNWETFPMEKLKRVDLPTTRINKDQIKRKSERQAGFCKAAAGDYGERLQKEMRRFVPKYPISGAIAWMRDNMRPFRDGNMAGSKAPLPNNTQKITRGDVLGLVVKV